MNLKNKLILGCAQSDKNYGLDKKNKFSEVFDIALKFKFKYFDTSASYKNSDHYFGELTPGASLIFQDPHDSDSSSFFYYQYL